MLTAPPLFSPALYSEALKMAAQLVDMGGGMRELTAKVE
jgi:hypothetical protein